MRQAVRNAMAYETQTRANASSKRARTLGPGPGRRHMAEAAWLTLKRPGPGKQIPTWRMQESQRGDAAALPIEDAADWRPMTRQAKR